MDATASSIIGVVQPYMFKPPEPQSDSESEGIDQPPTHRGSTTCAGGGGARNSNTPRTYDRRGGVRNSNTPRTYDRRGAGGGGGAR